MKKNNEFENKTLAELIKEFEYRSTRIKELNDEMKFLMNLIREMSGTEA